MSGRTAASGLRLQAFGDLVIFLVIVALAWQGLFKFVGASGMAPPIATVGNAFGLLSDPDFWHNVQGTFASLLFALVISISIGVCLGLILGFNTFAADVLEPILISLYSTPKIMFYPIFMMVFGLGFGSAVAFGVFHGIFPITLFTMSAVREIKPVLFKTARIMRLSTWQVMWYIAAPATIPEMFTGLRIGFAGVTVGVLLSEMFGARQGVGYLLMNAIVLNQIDIIMPLTFLVVVFALIVNFTLLVIDRRLHRNP